jgi:translation initiation factor 2 subunit 2
MSDDVCEKTFPYDYDHMLYQLHLKKKDDESYNKISLPPLSVCKKGKATLITNFLDYPRSLGRTVEQITKFYKDETAATNSINKDGHLIIQGKFKESQCENIMRNYVKQFCMCKQCKSIQTELQRENKFYYIYCQKCHAKSSLGKN